MGLCSKKLNLTVIVRNFRNGNIIFINEKLKKIDGILGDSYNKLIDNSNGGCNLIGTEEFGMKEINGTYEGALKLLFEKKGDVLINHTPHLVKKDFFYHSHSTHFRDISISHLIDDSKKEIENLSMYTLDERFAYLFFAILVFFTLLFLCFNKLIQGKKFSAFRLLENLFYFKFDYKKSINKNGLKIALQLIAVRIFITACKTLISQSIKVDRVLIKTDSLITSVDELFNSKLQVCWFIDNEITNVAINSPKENILYRLYNKDRSCFKSLSSMNDLFDYRNKAVFASKFYFEFFLARFVEFKLDIQYWISEPVFEYIMLHFYREGLNKNQIDAINRLSMNEMEYQLFTYVHNFPLLKIRQLNLNKPTIYYNLNNYISDNTVFYDYDLNFFDYSFKCLFILEFLAYLIYLINYFYIIYRWKFKLKFQLKKIYRLYKLCRIKIRRKLRINR